MMTHPATDELLAHVDGELPQHEVRALDLHLARCATCARTVGELRDASGMFAATLRTVDESEPAAWHDGGPLAAPAAVAATSVPARRIRSYDAGLRMLPRAAAILLLVAGAASAAIFGPALLGVGQTEPPPAVQAAGGTVSASLSVAPLDGRARITIVGAGSGTRLHVVTEPAEDVAIAIDGAATPHVTVATGRVEIDLHGSAPVVRITLPASLREAELTANGVLRARMVDGRITPETAREGIVIGTGSSTDP